MNGIEDIKSLTQHPLAYGIMRNFRNASGLAYVLIFAIIISLPACDLLPGSQTPTPSTVTPETETPIPATSPEAVNTPNFQLPEPTSQPKAKLIIWLPPEVASRTEQGAIVFSDQLLAFNSANPDLEITVEQKSVAGQGGILNYLRTGKKVAPSVMPDLIALPVRQITAVSDEGLIFPMEDVIDADAINTLYPVAQSWATHNDHLVSFPFAITELLQLEYNNSTITETTPLQWQDFITNTTHTMVMPTVGSSGAKLALQLYLQAGGSLENEAGQPTLEAEQLTLALQQLYDGRQNGFILPQSSNISTINEGRLLVLNGTTDYALSSSDEFLKGRTEEIIPGFSTIPGITDSLVPLVHGWAWAITTSDPQKKAVAVDLINTLTMPDNLGNWSLNSKILPANPAAFNQWPEEDVYITFADSELQRAESMSERENNTIMTILEDAVFDVISLSKTPEEAAEEAVTALQPPS